MSVHDENDATVYTCKNCQKRYTDHFDREIIDAHNKGYCCKIVSKKSGKKFDLYCGRGSIFGNPYTHIKNKKTLAKFIVNTREESIQKFKEYVPTNTELINNLYLLDNKILQCYCDFPNEDCHCRILLELREKQKQRIKYYTGIGSRETPDLILGQIFLIATALAYKGYILRSGGASGADSAFEKGCNFQNGKKNIYLPWKGFNSNNSDLYNVSPEALELAATIHPAWNRLSQGAQKLHARNCYQVLGLDLKTPSRVLICWTKNGEEIGGTATAIKLAKKHNIPVYNLGILGKYEELMEKLK